MRYTYLSQHPLVPPYWLLNFLCQRYYPDQTGLPRKVHCISRLLNPDHLPILGIDQLHHFHNSQWLGHNHYVPVIERLKRSKCSKRFTLWGVQLTFKVPFNFVQSKLKIATLKLFPTVYAVYRDQFLDSTI